MADIKTKLNIGDTVWWVNCSNKVYKGTIKKLRAATIRAHFTAAFTAHLTDEIQIRPFTILLFSSPEKGHKNLQSIRKKTLTMCFPSVWGAITMRSRRVETMDEYIERESAVKLAEKYGLAICNYGEQE